MDWWLPLVDRQSNRTAQPGRHGHQHDMTAAAAPRTSPAETRTTSATSALIASRRCSIPRTDGQQGSEEPLRLDNRFGLADHVARVQQHLWPQRSRQLLALQHSDRVLLHGLHADYHQVTDEPQYID
jgi:hypothetical protein